MTGSVEKLGMSYPRQERLPCANGQYAFRISTPDWSPTLLDKTMAQEFEG